MVRVLYSRASEAAGNQRIPQRSKPGVSPVSRIRPRPTIFVWVNYILVLQSGHPGYLHLSCRLIAYLVTPELSPDCLPGHTWAVAWLLTWLHLSLSPDCLPGYTWAVAWLLTWLHLSCRLIANLVTPELSPDCLPGYTWAVWSVCHRSLWTSPPLISSVHRASPPSRAPGSVWSPPGYS